MTLTSQASGQWSGEKPNCAAFSDTAIALFVGVGVSVIIIVMVSVACCLNKKKIRVILYMKCRWSFGNKLQVLVF